MPQDDPSSQPSPDRIAHLRSAHAALAASQIPGAVTVGQRRRRGALDAFRKVGTAETEPQRHRQTEDRGTGIGDALAGNIRRGD